MPWLAFLPLVAGCGCLAIVVLCERSASFSQFVKYGLIGVLSTYVQMAAFYALASTCLPCLGADDWAVRGLGLSSVEVTDGVRAVRFSLATGIGFLVANVFCWLMNRTLVFRPGKFPWPVEFVLFLGAATVATLVALGLSSALIACCGMMTSVAVLLEVSVSFLVNFLVRKFFIFNG